MKRATYKSSFITYILLTVVCLFVIFFVGKELNQETNKEDRIITSDGLNHFSKGMDIAGGVSLTYKIDLSKYRQAYTDDVEYYSVTRGIKDIILQNIDTRVSALGVSDYSSFIQTLDDGEYVVVELGGVSDLDQAKDIIGKTVELEFKLPYEGDGVDQFISRQLFAEQLLKDVSSGESEMSNLGQKFAADNVFYSQYSGAQLSELPSFYENSLSEFVKGEQGVVRPALYPGEYGDGLFFQGGQPIPGVMSGFTVVKFNGSREVDFGSGVETVYDFEDLFVDQRPSWVQAKDPKDGSLLNGAFFKFANVSTSQTGQPAAVVNFDETGKQIFCNITEEIIGKQMAIFVGGENVTAPVIQDKICGGSASITGSFDLESAKALVDELNSGALPAPLILSHEEKVSPLLGEKAFQGALIAAGLGLVLIFAFMVYMYGIKKGTIALLTLLIFIIVLLGITKLFKYAFSLSGIAAILLSLGMGVDANVLIYERIKEELNSGKTIFEAIEEGYKRSRSAIRDGNVTTLMIALLLFFLGTNVFKGFGTMMMVNIVLTLTVIVPLTRIFLHEFHSSK